MFHTFDAMYDPEGAASAERAFYVRSICELRRLSTFAPPVAFSLFVAIGRALGAPTWVVAFFAAFLVLSVLGPVFFYVARPLAAKRYALEHPVRRITLTPQSVQIAVGQQTASVAWSQVKHVWEASEYVLLVLGKYASISIPKRSLPPGANEFIRTSVQDAG
ncbi:MAG: YcxB family protein [Burkholderiales bacterium]|nr:YcxB family protein [Burkholderiales bacterium]